jgi:hypothetical protein
VKTGKDASLVQEERQDALFVERAESDSWLWRRSRALEYGSEAGPNAGRHRLCLFRTAQPIMQRARSTRCLGA